MKFITKKRIQCFNGVRVFIVGSIITLGSCKPTNISNTQSLDQFAGANSEYACSGSNFDFNDEIIDRYVLEANAEQKKAIGQSLSAIPRKIKEKIFSQNIRTFIKVAKSTENKEDIDHINVVCLGSSVAKAYKSREAETPYRSCHKIADGRVTIYVDPNPQQIRLGLVRALGYFLSEIDFRIDEPSSGKNLTIVNPVDSPQMKSDKARVALAFLSDIDNSKDFSLSIFKNLLPRSLLQEPNPASVRNKTWNSLSNLDEMAASLFSDYVVAEAFDSHYCNNESRKIMSKNFSITSKVLGLSANSKPDPQCKLCSYFIRIKPQYGLSLNKEPQIATELYLGGHAHSDGTWHGDGADSRPATTTKPAKKTTTPKKNDNSTPSKSTAKFNPLSGTNDAIKNRAETETLFPSNLQGKNVGEWEKVRNLESDNPAFKWNATSGDSQQFAVWDDKKNEWGIVQPTYNEDRSKITGYFNRPDSFYQGDAGILPGDTRPKSYTWSNSEGAVAIPIQGQTDSKSSAKFVQNVLEDGGFQAEYQYSGGKYIQKGDSPKELTWESNTPNDPMNGRMSTLGDDGKWNYSNPSTPAVTSGLAQNELPVISNKIDTSMDYMNTNSVYSPSESTTNAENPTVVSEGPPATMGETTESGTGNPGGIAPDSLPPPSLP